MAQTGPTAQTGAQLPSLYQADAIHGWSIGMRAVTLALLHTCPLPPGRVLEIGCGGGSFLSILQARYPTRTILGIDIHPLAIAHARKKTPVGRLYQSDAAHLPFVSASVAGLIALDVLDQVGIEPEIVLQEAARVLKPGGVILARVSAYPWLFGPHDHAFNTRQRYSRSRLHNLFTKTGFHIHRITHAAAIGLLAIVPRLLQRGHLLSWNECPSSQGNLVGYILARALQVEAQWLHTRNLPWGLSLYLIATRP